MRAILTACLAIQVAPAFAGELFEFRTGFWVSLHHWLYRESSTYRGQFKDRPLLFDDELIGIKDRLAKLEDDAEIRSVRLRPAVAKALENAARSYRDRLWAEHKRAAMSWLEQAAPLLSAHGEVISRGLSQAFGVEWPPAPLRVSLTPYAGFAGAYTTLEPAHITIDVTDERNRGVTALEVLFHEASHALIDRVRRQISTECSNQKKFLPRRDLWHAVLFYTTGDLVRRRLQGYTPYAERHGLWKTAWPMYHDALIECWQPYLDGRATMDEAIERLVARAGVTQ